MKRLVAHVAVVAAFAGLTTLGVMRSHHEPTGSIAASREAETTVVWRGLAVPVPAGWRRVSVGPDHGAWTSRDRQRSLTVTRVPAAPDPLGAVVAAAAEGLPRELPGVEAVTVRPGPARSRIDFRLRMPDGTTILARQIWVRQTSDDVITTWTARQGRSLPTTHARAAVPA